MDPPPLPPLPTAAAAATTIQVNYPDSVESSPRSRNAETRWQDEPLPPVPGAKLRLMCSYGGHIIPRPNDKSLCYVGGETRIVVVDRSSSLSNLSSRLSSTLLDGRPFSLKYQLPNEDLDSLISITTDEDLENMIEEYDRTTSVTNSKPSSRLRLFLFFSKPETAASMGSLLADAKSETWFVDALNNAGLLPRGLSDSATDCMLNLDGIRCSDSSNDLEAHAADSMGDNKQVKSNVHDVHSMSDSPMMENSSSFGSSSSTPSMSNLPPIRVRVEDNGARVLHDQKGGMEEQFAKMSFAPSGLKQDDAFGGLSAPPPLPTAAASASTVLSTAITTTVSHETLNRVFSDDQMSDQGVPVGFRKPPLPLQPVHMKPGGGYSLPSPDSVASDSSIASANSISRSAYYQDQVHVAAKDNRAPHSPSTGSDAADSSSRTQLQQVQDSGYILPPQLDQQQQQQQQHFVHANAHYIPHTATGQVPMSSYYHVYAPSSQQQFHQPMDQQYPVYVMPSVAQAQSYNMSMQANVADTNVAAASRPLASPNPGMVAAPAAYKDAMPPVYPTRTAAPAKPEMVANVYRTAVASNPQLVQVSSSQYPQQYMGFAQMHHPSQSVAVASSTTANYGYEYTNPPNEQVYYTHQAAPLPPQYQTMTAEAAIALSEASKQLPTDTLQQIRNSQPL